MADAADFANERMDLINESHLAARHRFEGASATHCNECDETIPERRRELLPGVRLCVECQQLEEDRRL